MEYQYGSCVKTATNTPVCSLLEGVSTLVLIIELLTAADKWDLSIVVLKLCLMIF
jgi:hypothetical protein